MVSNKKIREQAERVMALLTLQGNRLDALVRREDALADLLLRMHNDIDTANTGLIEHRKRHNTKERSSPFKRLRAAWRAFWGYQRV